MFSSLLLKLKSNPVTTVSGWLSLASGWLSAQPELLGHPTTQQLLKVACAAAGALFAALVADAKAK